MWITSWLHALIQNKKKHCTHLNTAIWYIRYKPLILIWNKSSNLSFLKVTKTAFFLIRWFNYSFLRDVPVDLHETLESDRCFYKNYIHIFFYFDNFTSVFYVFAFFTNFKGSAWIGISSLTIIDIEFPAFRNYRKEIVDLLLNIHICPS